MIYFKNSDYIIWKCLFKLEDIAAAVKLRQLCLTLHDPTDCSRPGSSIHGISQARVLEWVAIAFSEDIAANA